MYEETNKFHAVALPAFLVICLFLILIGCAGGGKVKPPHVCPPKAPDIVVNEIVIDAISICNNTDGDAVIEIDGITRVVVNNNKCIVTIDITEENEDGN